MLLPQSTELKLVGMTFDGKQVSLEIEDDLGDESRFSIEMSTSVVVSFLSKMTSPDLSRFRFEVVKISDFLSTNSNGYYDRPSNDNSIMKLSRMGLSACIGGKPCDYSHAIQLIGGLLYCTFILSEEGYSTINVQNRD